MIGGEGRRGGEKQRKEMEGGRGTAAIGHKRGRKGEEGGRERKGERKREGGDREVRRGRREGNSCNKSV